FARLSKNEIAIQACQAGLGELLLKLNQLDSALDYLIIAAESNPGRKAFQINIYLHYLIGEAYVRKGDYNNAIIHLNNGIALAKKYQILDHTYKMHAAIAEAYGAIQQFDKAWNHQKLAAELKDNLTSKERLMAIDQLEFKYQSLQKDMTIARKDLLIIKQENLITRKNLLITLISICTVTLTVISTLFYRNRQHRQRIQDQRIKDIE